MVNVSLAIRIVQAQKEDEWVKVHMAEVLDNESKWFVETNASVKLQGILIVPNVVDLRTKICDEKHKLR